MIRFILCVIVVVGFLILIHSHSLLVEWIIGKFNPMAKGNQLSSDRSGSISFYPVDIRCEADCYRRGKCTN